MSSRLPHGVSRIYAPVSDVGGRSKVGRIFSFGVSGLSVSYARRNRSLDGASCANPYVVVGTDLEAGGPSASDRFAGRVRVVVHAINNGKTMQETAQWRSAAGYRTCFAAGLGMGPRGAWVDRRHGDSLSHVLDSWEAGANHLLPSQYFFAAFRKA
jgi:hypothetical protein